MNFQSTIHRVLSAVARRVVVPAYEGRFRQFERLLHEARRVQRDMLFGWIRRCRDTRFGRDHGFAEINSLDDYRRRVPISRYDYFAPYINAVARGEFTALFPPEERVERFTITTGTTGAPKLNPVTRPWLKEYRKSWDLWGGKMLLDHLPKVGTKIVQLIGSRDMGRTPGKIPISMVSALLARQQRPFVRSFYAIPNEITDIRDPVSRWGVETLGLQRIPVTLFLLRLWERVSGRLRGVWIGAFGPGAFQPIGQPASTERSPTRHRSCRDLADRPERQDLEAGS